MPTLLINASETELFRALLKQKVRFVVVGGHAVIFHGYLRPAKDLDIFVDSESDNASRLHNALLSINIRNPDLSSQRLSMPNQQIRINGHFNIELLTSITGLTFEEAYASATYTLIEELSVPVLSYENLIKSKRALGRDNDIEDIEALENLTK